MDWNDNYSTASAGAWNQTYTVRYDLQDLYAFGANASPGDDSALAWLDRRVDEVRVKL